MLRLEVIFCLLFVNYYRGSAQFLTCPEVTQDTASCESVESWLCGFYDWLGSMKEWKDTVEEACSKGDLGAQWEELFSCPYPVTVECVNKPETSCGNDPFNCEICYCQDGKYKDRQNYLHLWKNHQETYRKSLVLYKEKIKFCGQRTACPETNAVTTKSTETTDATQQLPTDNTTITDTTTIETITAVSTTIEESSETSESQSVTTISTEPVNKETTPSYSTATTAQGQCELYVSDICYWIYFNFTNPINFTEAQQICAEKGSVPAYYPTELAYNKTMESLRMKIIANGKTKARVYTGIMVGDNTDAVTHPDSKIYTKWFPGEPEPCEDCTSVFLNIDNIDQGMWIDNPNERVEGVVCQNNLN